MHPLDFSKTFELECDAFDVGICSLLLQGGKPIAYFSKTFMVPPSTIPL